MADVLSMWNFFGTEINTVQVLTLSSFLLLLLPSSPSLSLSLLLHLCLSPFLHEYSQWTLSMLTTFLGIYNWALSILNTLLGIDEWTLSMLIILLEDSCIWPFLRYPPSQEFLTWTLSMLTILLGPRTCLGPFPTKLEEHHTKYRVSET